MFSKDPDEVNDLFQDILIKLWKGSASSIPATNGMTGSNLQLRIRLAFSVIN